MEIKEFHKSTSSSEEDLKSLFKEIIKKDTTSIHELKKMIGKIDENGELIIRIQTNDGYLVLDLIDEQIYTEIGNTIKVDPESGLSIDGLSSLKIS